jgi:hypothetical protein
MKRFLSLADSFVGMVPWHVNNVGQNGSLAVDLLVKASHPPA